MFDYLTYAILIQIRLYQDKYFVNGVGQNKTYLYLSIISKQIPYQGIGQNKVCWYLKQIKKSRAGR